jgi:hypothetical protein
MRLSKIALAKFSNALVDPEKELVNSDACFRYVALERVIQKQRTSRTKLKTLEEDQKWRIEHKQE